MRGKGCLSVEMEEEGSHPQDFCIGSRRHREVGMCETFVHIFVCVYVGLSLAVAV